MKNYQIFFSLISLFILNSCATTEERPKIHEDEPKEDFAYPDHKEIEKSFYLLGDGGYSPEGSSSEGLIAFKRFLDSVQEKGNYSLFLGDNIYPSGLPPKEDKDRERSEYRLDAQLDAIEDYDGNVIFIPGNHDWYDSGIDGLKRQEEYLKEKFEDEDRLTWSPKSGCGLDIIEVSENINMIVIDSQWFLEDWDKHPLINDDCEEIKTREALLVEIETEFKKSQNKTIIVALHHPLLTNGIHGGQYNFTHHLYPTQKKIPFPILGSLVSLIRTTGGVSIQDAQNERYKNFVNRLKTLAQKPKRLIFVAGHEHSLQYVEEEKVKQIVSGSASKATYANLSNNGRFAYPGQGFAVFDVFKDGSSWVSFYGNEENEPKLLFQKEIFEAPQPYDISQLESDFPDTIITSVYNKEETEKSGIHRTVWGDRYRKIFGTPIEVKVADLDTLYGGLEPMRLGGGHQTISVRVRDSLKREYNFRRVKKNAVQYLQAVAFQNKPVKEDFRNTVAEDMMNDLYTASHPFAFMAVPTLADAVDVLHTNPELYYLPKQPKLGKFNEVHGDDIYMIEERPEEHWMGHESFGRPNHDIESTDGMFERLRRDEKYKLDEAAYVRARIFDMLIGDWDRHKDQWRWAEIEDENGDRLFKPIPRDRDQVFSNYDGIFFGTLRAITGFAGQFGQYDEDIKDIEWFNIAAIGLDRSLLQNVGKGTWEKEAKFIRENVSDEVIEEAFSHLPEGTQGEVTEDIIKKLKGRRDNIEDIAMRYYDHLSELAIVTGTDKDDYIDVTRMEDGKTRVKIMRNIQGDRQHILSDKVYTKDETDEIWIYALDDDDKIKVRGEGDKPIFTRIIGGQNNDIYTIENGDKIKIYDHKTKPNTIEKEGNAKFRFTDKYEINTYDRDKKIYKGGAVLPAFGYNPDDGFKFGVEVVNSIYAFKRNPFTAQHRFRAGYYFATNGFDLGYESQFANILGNYNLKVGAFFNSPNYARNFFGYGNETENNDDIRTYDYNRVKISSFGTEFGFVNKTPFGSYFSYTANVESNKVEETEGRFIAENFEPDSPNFFDRKYFAGLDALYRYESYDDNLNPTNGMKFELNLGGKINLENTDRHYGYFKPYWSFYNALTRNRRIVLRTKASAQINMGNDYEFYQAAQLGGDTGLRGYRLQRFTGKSFFATGGDLRYSFKQLRTRILPFQIGVFAGYDLGRVWNDNDYSNQWHDSYGGGIWVNSAEAVNGTFSLFKSDDGYRFSFGFGFEL